MSNLIADLRDLEETAPGQYYLNFRNGRDDGAIRCKNDVLASKWYVSYEFMIGPDWTWGTTDYSGGDKFLSNVKCIRFWNPGSTSENIVVTMQGWDDALVGTVEGIEPEQYKYFFDGYTNRLTKGVWHRFEFELIENSRPGASDGSFSMWFDGDVVLNAVNLITRKNEAGYKRPFIVGFASMWGDSTDHAPNDFYMRNVIIEPEKTRADVVDDNGDNGDDNGNGGNGDDGNGDNGDNGGDNGDDNGSDGPPDVYTAPVLESMTLRDFFAAMALRQAWPGFDPEEIAGWAYTLADQMVEQKCVRDEEDSEI